MRPLSHALVRAIVGLISVAFMGGCLDTDSGGPKEGTPPYACNTVVDVECTAKQELALDAVSGLGFSANDVLSSIVGNYEIPIRWFSPCVEPSACGAGDDCSRFAEQPPVSVAGTTTTLRLGLTAWGPAEVVAPGPGQGACGQYMRIFGAIRVQTEDGAVDMERDDVVIWTDCGNELSVRMLGPASQLVGGTLGAELGDGTSSYLDFGATRDNRVWFRLSFIRQVQPAPRPVTLWGEMLAGNCYETVPRREVLVGAE